MRNRIDISNVDNQSGDGQTGHRSKIIDKEGDRKADKFRQKFGATIL